MSGSQASITEETLMALADAELEGEEAMVVEAAVAKDPALRETLRLLRQSAPAIAHAFDQTLKEPVPARLLAAARGAAPKTAPVARRPRLAGWTLAFAASLAAFAIGLGTSYLMVSSSPGYSPAAETPSDALAARFEVTLRGALDNGKEDQTFPYASQDMGKGTIKLGSRFTMASGAQCREFWRRETRGRSQLSDHGIACRGANGTWSMMVLPGSS